VYREGVGFFYNGLAVSVGFDFGLSWNCFAFVPIGHFCDPHPHHYRVAPGQATQIYNHTTVINNFNVRDHRFVNHGIDPERITTVTHTPIRPISIRDTDSPFGRGQRGDQLSHDGRTLIVNRPHFVDHPVPGENRNNRPMPSAPPAPNHSLQPNGNQPAPPTHPMRQPQVPNVTPHSPQDRNAFSAPNQTQRPSPPANLSTPGQDNRIFSPRGREQLQPSRGNTRNSDAWSTTPSSNQGQSGASEASHHNAPAAAPVERPQHNESSSSPRSSGQNQNQNSSGNNSNNGPGNGSGRGPGH
jgi:hypothetical protein